MDLNELHTAPLLRHTSIFHQHKKPTLFQKLLHILPRGVNYFPFLTFRGYRNDFKHNRKLFWKRLGLDAVAGITIGAMTIPQAMSFATVAGLQPVYGLYNSFIATLPYPFLGTSHHLVPGPTAVMSVMVKQSIPGSVDGDFVVQELHQYLSFTLAFLAGILQVFLGVLGFGNLVNLISEPVLTGFTFAAAFLVASTQFASAVGVINCSRDDGKACNFVNTVENVINSVSYIEAPTPLCSIIGFLFLFIFKSQVKKLKKYGWIANFGSLILMIMSIVLVYQLNYGGGESNVCVASGTPPCESGINTVQGMCCVLDDPFHKAANGEYDYNQNIRVYDKKWHIRQVGPIRSGLPNFQVPFQTCSSIITNFEYRSFFSQIRNRDPPFPTIDCIFQDMTIIKKDVTYDGFGEVCTYYSSNFNSTKLYNISVLQDAYVETQQCASFDEIKRILYSSVSLAVLGFIEGLSIAKVISRKVGGCDVNIHPSNELFALGSCNLLCSFFQGYPVTGSFSRTAVNAEAGATSSLALFFCSLIILLSLLVLTPILQYMPRFALSAIVMDSVVRMIDIKYPLNLWQTDKRDLAVFCVTFFFALFDGIEEGLIIGVLLSWTINLVTFIPSDFSFFSISKKYEHQSSFGSENENLTENNSPVIIDSYLETYQNIIPRPKSDRQTYWLAKLVIHHNLSFSISYRIIDSVQDILVTFTPFSLILDITAARAIDMNGLSMLARVTEMCINKSVRFLLLAGASDALFQKIVNYGNEIPFLKSSWDRSDIFDNGKPLLHNPKVTMLMFNSVLSATNFVEDQVAKIEE